MSALKVSRKTGLGMTRSFSPAKSSTLAIDRLLFVALRIIRLKQIITIFHQSLGEFLLIVATAAASLPSRRALQEKLGRGHKVEVGETRLEQDASGQPVLRVRGITIRGAGGD